MDVTAQYDTASDGRSDNVAEPEQSQRFVGYLRLLGFLFNWRILLLGNLALAALGYSTTCISSGSSLLTKLTGAINSHSAYSRRRAVSQHSTCPRRRSTYAVAHTRPWHDQFAGWSFSERWCSAYSWLLSLKDKHSQDEPEGIENSLCTSTLCPLILAKSIVLMVWSGEAYLKRIVYTTCSAQHILKLEWLIATIPDFLQANMIFDGGSSYKCINTCTMFFVLHLRDNGRKALDFDLAMEQYTIGLTL
jgi:hypothetical protein